MEIAAGIYDVAPPKRGYLKAGFSKAVIVDGGDGLIVIDTLYDADAGDILDEIRRIGKTPADIKHIVLTHSHRGHLGGLATLKRLSGAPVYAHPWEADIISGDRGRQEPSLFVLNPIQTYPIIFFGRLTAAFTKHKPLTVDHMIADGDKIGPLQVVHTPGHTPGHLALYWPEQRALITGDAFVTWPMLCYGWPNSMLNHKQSWESLIKMAELDAEVLSPGHGDSIRQNGAAVLRNMVARGKR